jgi:hypothetical protein
MLWAWAAGLALGALAPRALAAGATFEEVAAQATPIADLAMLLPPFVDDCARSRREPERGRCLGIRAFLRRDLPARSFVITRPGAEAITVSDYEGSLRGYRLTVSGCLACDQPVQAGAERRFVTLKAPGRGARSLRSGTVLGHTAISFPDPVAAEGWARAVQPHLRVEYVFQPADETWTAGAVRGLAFKALAFRVYDACTGAVAFSQPPSREPAAKDAGCTPAPAVAAAANAVEAAPPEPPLDAPTINTAVMAVRGDFDACVKQFPMPGTATLAFVVAPTGIPQSVAVEGGAAGTPLAQCLTEVATKVRFPVFQGPHQRFKYPLNLKRPPAE